MDIRIAQKECYDIAAEKGWHPEDDHRTIGDWLTLIHSEISEAYEEYRNGHEINEIYFNGEKPEGFPIEIADAHIRILDLCEKYGIDLSAVTRLKMDYNKTRSFRHGGKIA